MTIPVSCLNVDHRRRFGLAQATAAVDFRFSFQLWVARVDTGIDHFPKEWH